MNPTWLYVLAVYTLAVWLARRAGAALPWRAAALFYLLVLIFLFKPMTQAFVNIPVDFVQLLPPWAYLTRHPHAYNGELNDLALQVVPWAEQVRESWKSLHVPLWNARSGSGYPLLANGQSSALSILRLIALPLSLGHSFTAEAAMKLLIALTFTYLYCRKRGWSELASVAGSIAFGFSTFVIVWLHFPIVSATCFFPAAMFALELLAERITYRRFVFAAAVWTLMIFGGHPETVAHVFFFSLLTVIWMLFVERPFATWRDAARFVVALGGALAVAAILASPFLAPFAEGIKKSKRFQELQVMPNEIGYYSDWASKVILIAPHFFGEVPIENQWGSTHAESITGFAGILGAAGWLALLVNAVVTRRFRTREVFFVVVTPVILGIVLAWPLVSTAFHAVFAIAANARLRLLLCFVSAMMTASLVDLVQRSAVRAYLIGIAGAAALLAYLMFGTGFPMPWHKDVAMLAIIPSMIVLAIAALLPLANRNGVRLGICILLVAVIAELWKVGGVWNPVLPERLMYPETPLIAALKKAIDSEYRPCRMVASGPVLFANTPAVFGINDIRAHDPMASGRYLGTLRVVAGYDTSDYFAQWKNFDTRLLDFLNVCYVVTTPDAKLRDVERYSPIYEGRDGRVFRNNDVLPRFFAPSTIVLEFNGDKYTRKLAVQSDFSDTAIVKRLPVENDRERADLLAPRPPGAPKATLILNEATDTDYDLIVNAPRYTMIVSSLPWWPGWHVTANGKELEALQPNGTFIGFVVRPGMSRVHIYYSPMTFKLGAILSLLTIAILAALWQESLRQRLRPARRSE
jgi:membrane protein YfhO